MKYDFRKCTYDDVDFIVHLKDLGLRCYMEKLYGWDYDVQIEKTTHELDRHIDDMRIITVEGKDAGITTFFKEDDEYTVGLIIVHPDYQGSGIATKIISEYIDIAKKDKKKIKIKTYKYNPAQNLYKRLGFKQIKEDDTHIYFEM